MAYWLEATAFMLRVVIERGRDAEETVACACGYLAEAVEDSRT